MIGALGRFSDLLGALAAVLALSAAAVAAVLTGSEVGHVNTGVESIASLSGAWLGALASALPLGYAFGAGMVAAANPCGFAVLPAYLALYLGASEEETAGRSVVGHLWQAIWVSSMMTVGFVVLFGAAGIALSFATSAIARYLPWLGLLVGVLLLMAGGGMLSGRALYTNVGERLADRLGAGARQRGARGYFTYGLVYAAASLSCTLPIFLAVVASGLTAGGLAHAALQFVLYALGMGFTIVLLTSSTAFFKFAALRRMRSFARHVQPASAVLLLFAGAYVVYYWLTIGGLLPL